MRQSNTEHECTPVSLTNDNTSKAHENRLTVAYKYYNTQHIIRIVLYTEWYWRPVVRTTKRHIKMNQMLYDADLPSHTILIYVSIESIDLRIDRSELFWLPDRYVLL